MLFTPKVMAALEDKRLHFRDYQVNLQAQEGLLADWLAWLRRQSADSLTTALEQIAIAWPGARPTAEFDRAPDLRLAFDQHWVSHVEARTWALTILRDRPVAAVDGSQITPTKDLSIPIGAVQIGWFINFHQAGGWYIKDITFDVLAPTELTEGLDEASDQAESNFPTQQVNRLRFLGECERLCAIMAEYAAVAEEQRPLCFFDGSLIVSFAGLLLPIHAQAYVQAVRKVLDASERYRVPLVGFVDSSLSRDLVTLLEVLHAQPDALNLTDGGLIKLAGLLPAWGDRTPLFFCARDDRLSRSGQADFYEDVAFSYIQLASERPPARLELPRWLVEAGRAEEIINLVRAECVVGMGYPYAIETADALAVISQQDRQRFYALFEQFAQRSGLSLTRARKAISKQTRR
jgi:hypothetical protein